MNLSKREFLQVLGAASVAGMGLARYENADAQTAAGTCNPGLIEAHLDSYDSGLAAHLTQQICGLTGAMRPTSVTPRAATPRPPQASANNSPVPPPPDPRVRPGWRPR